MPDAITGRRRVPRPENDPNLTYAPGTPARAELKARLATMASETVDIPIVIGGKEIRNSGTLPAVMPHKHGHVLGQFHQATPDQVRQAVEAAMAARKEWSGWSFEDRAAVWQHRRQHCLEHFAAHLGGSGQEERTDVGHGAPYLDEAGWKSKGYKAAKLSASASATATTFSRRATPV